MTRLSRCAWARSVLPTNSFKGFGGVFMARRIASSRRRAISSSVKSGSEFSLADMPSPDLFKSPRALINRARENRTEFNQRSQAFIDDKPYAQFIEPEPETGLYLLKIRLTKDFPDSIAAVASDAIKNIRDSLDQIICGALFALRPGVSLSGVYFPFGDDPVHLEHAIAKGCGKLPPEIAAIIRGFNPHKGGDAVFWALNRLARRKHQALFELIPDPDTVEVYLLEVMVTSPVFRPYWDPAKKELVISRTTKEREPGYDLDTAFYIAFGDVEAVSGFPAVPVLDYLIHIAGRVLVAVEAETLRLLIETINIPTAD